MYFINNEYTYTHLARQNLRSVSKSGKINRDTLSDWAVWSIVEQSSKQIGIEHFGARDLRRTCAKLCRKNGGDLEQIKFLLGHSSIQTTERYLGSEQEIAIAERQFGIMNAREAQASYLERASCDRLYRKDRGR
jgi:integrase